MSCGDPLDSEFGLPSDPAKAASSHMTQMVLDALMQGTSTKEQVLEDSDAQEQLDSSVASTCADIIQSRYHLATNLVDMQGVLSFCSDLRRGIDELCVVHVRGSDRAVLCVSEGSVWPSGVLTIRHLPSRFAKRTADTLGHFLSCPICVICLVVVSIQTISGTSFAFVSLCAILGRDRHRGVVGIGGG